MSSSWARRRDSARSPRGWESRAGPRTPCCGIPSHRCSAHRRSRRTASGNTRGTAPAAGPRPQASGTPPWSRARSAASGRRREGARPRHERVHPGQADPGSGGGESRRAAPARNPAGQAGAAAETGRRGARTARREDPATDSAARAGCTARRSAADESRRGAEETPSQQSTRRATKATPMSIGRESSRLLARAEERVDGAENPDEERLPRRGRVPVAARARHRVEAAASGANGVAAVCQASHRDHAASSSASRREARRRRARPGPMAPEKQQERPAGAGRERTESSVEQDGVDRSGEHGRPDAAVSTQQERRGREVQHRHAGPDVDAAEAMLPAPRRAKKRRSHGDARKGERSPMVRTSS